MHTWGVFLNYFMKDYITGLYETLNKYKSKENTLFNRGVINNTQSLIDEFERNEFLNEKAEQMIDFYLGFSFNSLPHTYRVFAAKKCALNDLDATINALFDVGDNAKDYIDLKKIILANY